MPEINDKKYTKKDILGLVGNMDQLAGITSSTINEGKATGTKIYSFKNGTGLEFTLNADRALDISSLCYKGTNISFVAKPGMVSPFLASPTQGEFVEYAGCGMMFTCGLLNAGNDSVDTDGKYYPIHGRIGITPAEKPYCRTFWSEQDEYILEAGGVIKDCALFGRNLSLTRKITSKLGSNEIIISDELENLSHLSEEFMLLYHCNFGFPFLSEKTEIIFPENTVKPRTKTAEEGLNDSEKIIKPQDNFSEHVFFRDIKADKDGFVTVRLENKELGIGIYIKYDSTNLPILTQWKSMQKGDYVLGIEPSNSFIMGRKDERENGTINKIAAFQKLSFTIIIGAYDI